MPKVGLAVDNPPAEAQAGEGRRDRIRSNAPPLVKLRRSQSSDASAAFGSLRFPARTMPAKFVHLAPDSESAVLVSLLVDTWRLATPCAVLALNPPNNFDPALAMNTADETNSRLNLMLRRGLAEHVERALWKASQLPSSPSPARLISNTTPS